MISNKDLHEELSVIEEAVKNETDAYKKASLKAQSLQIKLLYNIRTNMVTIMRSLNIPMRSNVKSNETEKEQ